MLRDLMRDRASVMPRDPFAANVTALRVWQCSYDSLVPVEQYPNLRTLVVASYPDADLSPLGHLEGLEYLRLMHLPRVHDLAPLASLRQLVTVRLETLPSWDSSGKVTVVDSLRPLALLPNLAHLELFGVRPPTKSLQDLEEAPALASLRVSKYPKAEIARFREVTGLSNAFAPRPDVVDWD